MPEHKQAGGDVMRENTHFGAFRSLAACAAIAASIAFAPSAWAQNDEAAAAALFDRLAEQPPRLRVFLQAMPKGGDLHNHLWGQPYAEQFLQWSGDMGYCVSREALAIVPPPCKAPEAVPAKDLGRKDAALYEAMIVSLSTRGRDQGLGVNDTTGHDDFFSTFGRFYPAALVLPGAMLASAQTSAAANGVSYLELIQNPRGVDQGGDLALSKPWTDGEFATNLERIAPQVPALVDSAIAELNEMERDAGEQLHCESTAQSGPCSVTVRYLPYGLRSMPPAYIFGQLAVAFALADKDPRVVAVNIVAPEDGPVAVADFDLHMRMFRFFSERYPGVKKTLHAGELSLGLVPPDALSDHIRQSIEVAGASRIGHGVDISFETDAPALLAKMKRKGIAVEINLTSNDTILGVRGPDHPLSLYRAAGVPVALSTDDEGVSRSNMTNEYMRGASEQGLRYADLKAMARASLEYSFLSGASLWQDAAQTKRVPACRNALVDDKAPTGACGDWLSSSEKARAQWRLEGEFALFERTILQTRF